MSTLRRLHQRRGVGCIVSHSGQFYGKPRIGLPLFQSLTLERQGRNLCGFAESSLDTVSAETAE
jgi:hypothetical protein